MNRSLTGTILWVCLVGAMGATLFFIKHEVKDLETRLSAVHHDIASNEDEIHVLNAEWSYLNDPARLRDEAERHLGMKQMGPNQVATLDSIASGAALVLEQRVHQAPAAHMAANTAPQADSPRANSSRANTPVVAMADARALPAQPHSAPQAKPHAPPSGLAMASTFEEAR